MDDKNKYYIGYAVGFLVVWDLIGLMEGNGFAGGIRLQIEAIGNILRDIIYMAIIFGIAWYVLSLLGKKANDSTIK